MSRVLFTPPFGLQQANNSHVFSTISSMVRKGPEALTFVGLMVAGAGSARVSGWMQAASDGYCAKTGKSDGGGSDCTIGNHGSFVLSNEDYLSLYSAFSGFFGLIPLIFYTRCGVQSSECIRAYTRQTKI